MTENRPYPCVERHGRGWIATWPGGPKRVYLGLFPSPEAARSAVLERQAQHLEEKAARYRAEAAALGELA